MSIGYNLNFLSNNVNGLNLSKKQTKMFEYFTEKITNNGILFLHETRSSHDTVINWHDNFKSALFYPHGTTNSSGVIIGYLGSKKIKVNIIKNDNQSGILIVDADIDKKNICSD